MGVLDSFLGGKSNRHLQEIVSAINLSQAMIEFDLDGRVLAANQNFLNVMGYELEEIVGKHHSIFVAPDYAKSKEYSDFWLQLKQGKAEATQFKRYTKNGDEIWIQASYNPIFDASGKPKKVVKFATDITAQKAAEQKSIADANYANALKSCQANVMLADNDLKIVYLNDTVEKMLKGREAELRTELPSFEVDKLIGTCVDDFHKQPAHQRQILSTLTTAYSTTLSVAGLTFKLIASPWIGAQGQRLGTLVEWQDLTEETRRLASEKLIAASNSRTKAALDVCQANVMMADENYNIVYVNQSVVEMLRSNQQKLREVLPTLDADNLIGTSIDSFHKNPAHQRNLLANLTDVYKTKLKLVGLTFDLIATPVFDESGKRLGTVVEWHDLTEKIRAEEKDAEKQRYTTRLKAALDVCQANVMMANTELEILYVNHSLTNMLKVNERAIQTQLPGFSVEKLVGTCVDDFHKQPSHQRGVISQLTTAYNTQLNIGGLIFDLIATPVISEDGERLGTVVEWKDMTEELARRKEERSIHNENLRIRQALDNVATNTMIADAENNIIYMNRAVKQMLADAESDIKAQLPNFDASNLLHQNMDVFHKNPGHQKGLISKLSSTYSAQINVGVRVFSLTANPIKSDDGERIGTVVEWVDRTEEVGIEREIDSLIENASAGDLSSRLDETGKSGFFLNLCQGLNKLVGVADGIINDTVVMLDAMAHGNLTKRIDGDYSGTFAKLKDDANSTVTKLTEIIARINQAATTVATGADEIAQGNADLSQRTEEQASSLEETASSMEEMTSTVRQNADNSQIANDLATEARKKAAEGGSVVERAVSAMQGINQSSNQIADIIGVIDEIAFQTNLLALNAAVEAARAGEQGRGFAVVAGEVRNLAQRSAEAAKEIKNLIRDSVAKVEDGSNLVNESGATLAQIVSAVERVSQMIADISIASNEQSTGIEQVNKAVAQMDEMTQQNAALVEEASAAGESMSEQARAMKQLLSFFTVESGSDSRHVELVGQNRSAAPLASVKPKTQESAKLPSAAISFEESDDDWEEF
ncbi:methyl-accepting chemotaxis protein [Catenovulum maritimum]|uniref:methyl-accepting chemotaxis protein n=1 Tax=Catenovulum maritimum TaxID=1513271 RepID=UPI00069E9AEB|nr:methyl-accepting chemotaxis protein [Catenovulum maritimum]